MSTPESLASLVQAAISGQNASAATVTTLQNLLSSATSPTTGSKPESPAARQPGPASRTQRAGRAATSVKSARGTASATKGSRKAENFTVLGDDERPLPPKARYALALSVVSLSLKVLSDATKSKSRVQNDTRGTPVTNLSATPAKTKSTSQRALQVRSGNATPLQRSPSKDIDKDSANSNTHDISCPGALPGYLVPTAECARLAFSLLRRVDAKKLSVKELPRFQLEDAMLSLCGKLLSLGLHSLATKELNAVKKRLNSSLPGQPRNAPTKTSFKATQQSEKISSPADLLDIQLDVQKTPEAWPLLGTYHLLALRLIGATRSPSEVEQSVQHLCTESSAPIVQFALHWCKSGKEDAKALKHLEALCQAILQLCPSVSESADEAAKDLRRNASPLSVFRLQATSLRLRREARDPDSGGLDIEKDQFEPFTRCFHALSRRTTSNSNATTTFEICHQEFERLNSAYGLEKSNATRSTIARILSTFAERASLLDLARELAELAAQKCQTLERTHSGFVSATARKLSTLLISQSSQHMGVSASCDLEILIGGLQGNVSGNSLDYGDVLSEIAHLLMVVYRRKTEVESAALWRRFAGVAAGFASRYVRKFPERHLEVAHDIVQTALSLCASHDDSVSWVSRDVANVPLQSGVLRTIAQKASSRSMELAWNSVNKAVSFGRILKILTLKAATSDPNRCVSFLIDRDDLDLEERGALLERQLKHQVDLAYKSQHHKTLAKLLSETFERLAKVYDHAAFPVRRARVAALAFRVREEHPNLLAPHTLAFFSHTVLASTDELGNDEGLRFYTADIQSSLGISKVLADGRPSVADLGKNLSGWQSILDTAQDVPTLELSVDSPRALIAHLSSLDEYFGILGEDEARVPVLQMLITACRRSEARSSEINSLLRLSRVHLLLGTAEKVPEYLEASRALLDLEPSLQLERLDLSVCRAEYLFCTGRVDDCERAMRDALTTHEELKSRKLHSSQAMVLKLVRARGWLLYSRHALECSQPSEALRAAMRLTKYLNGLWAFLERTESKTEPQMDLAGDESSMDNLSNKVSKLNLKSSSGVVEQQPNSENRKGALFWPVVRLLCSSLLHLCDIYARHGIFCDANHASEQALKIAESVGAPRLAWRIQSHRAIFLSISGRLEEAELSLAKHEEIAPSIASLATVEHLRARATLCAKSGDLEQSYHYLAEAEKMAKALQSVGTGSSTSAISEVEGEAMGTPDAGKHPVSTSKRGPASKAVPKGGAKSRFGAAKVTSKAVSTSKLPAGDFECSMLKRLENDLALEKALAGLQMGKRDRIIDESMQHPASSATEMLQRRRFEYEVMMVKIWSALQADFSLNVLPESTLAYPGVQGAVSQLVELLETNSCTAPLPSKSTGKKTTSLKGAKQKVKAASSLEELLTAASKCLSLEPKLVRLLSTAEAHRNYSQLSAISVMLSATSSKHASGMLHPVQEAFTAERARINASSCQRTAALLERESRGAQSSTAWPGQEEPRIESGISATAFESDFLDILPASWTTVSLSLSEKCDELYIARYRCDETPFLVRLPFSRQKSEDTEEEVFDFHAGKAELTQIIEHSNFSCHNPGDMATTGAKAKWWAQREALDKQLHELLLNIENLWLGGFKGIFSQHQRDAVQLERFRKAFEAILDRHLPSRKAAKRSAKQLALDDHIMNLFIGLAKDVDSADDLDEPISDLLYFVTDIFQFNGERNAYDEIDFDSMGIEVLDALRTYNDATENDELQDSHLILVLDRRLQAFPWESLPCLEKCSISRVDSMLTLQERVLQLKRLFASKDECYSVQRTSGTYILNPSSDLKSTEATLKPELAKLEGKESSAWKSIVGRGPSEAEFQEALTSSSTLLYFGHGAGTQYFRARALRRLESCSEVVWLIGCSSGSVTEYGDLEPFAVPLAYLTAGQEDDRRPDMEPDDSVEEAAEPGKKCMAVVGMLWDVTDKDIDRFSLATGEEWGLWKPAQEATKLPAKTPKKREKMTAPTTPERRCKTPKTPKARKTPAPTRTPNRSRSRPRREERTKGSLSEAVAKSRDSCYLRYLNGAAPVVYGVPVYLGD